MQPSNPSGMQSDDTAAVLADVTASSGNLASRLTAVSAMQGTLRVGRFNSFEAKLACDSMEEEILISGRVSMNRALDGDVVAVELLPEVWPPLKAHRFWGWRCVLAICLSCALVPCSPSCLVRD